LDKKVID